MKKRILALVMTVLMLTVLLSSAAYADDGADFGTGMHWAYTEATKTLAITGTGAIENFDNAAAVPWSAYNEEITAVTIADTVTSIGSYAFAGTKITTVTIPQSVTTLAASAFPALSSITAPCRLKNNLPAATTTTLTHKGVKVDEVAATSGTTGMKQHWKCSDCNKLFSDEACTTDTTEAELIIPKTDSEAPTLTNVYFDRSSVSQPASVVVTVIADDNDLSGVSNGSISLNNFSSGSSSTVSCSLTLNGSILTGTLNFAETASSGDYYISTLTLVDKSGNSRTYTYSNLDAAFKNVKITVTRAVTATTNATLTMNATSVGYGGTVTGTILLKDANGNLLPNKSFDVYVGNTKSSITATTDANGSATFNYSNTIAGTYTLKATFVGDTDYYACETNSVNVTFTTVPATGDNYNVMLWSSVAVLAICVNAWFIFKKKRA